jgi:hypothetical protein
VSQAGGLPAGTKSRLAAPPSALGLALLTRSAVRLWLARVLFPGLGIFPFAPGLGLGIHPQDEQPRQVPGSELLDPVPTNLSPSPFALGRPRPSGASKSLILILQSGLHGLGPHRRVGYGHRTSQGRYHRLAAVFDLLIRSS